ncbi:uncharacterized protein L199_006259 [Kwoniella botswanensis]|uniref:uncharacterized protein n=1 Tax=Kwoniella botswanensis TaxID=1268659 RepID=UPI00315D9CBB
MKSDTKKDPPIRSYFCPIQQQREVLASYTSSGTTTYKNIDVVTDYAICQNVYIREPSTDENFSDAEDFSEIIQEQYPLDGRSKVPCIWDIEQLAERWGFKEKVGISPVWQSTANNIDFLYKPKSKANTSSLLDTAIDIEQRVDDWSLI